MPEYRLDPRPVAARAGLPYAPQVFCSPPRFACWTSVAVFAAALCVGPARADEAKVRAYLERARELQASGGTDVARWLRELRSARQALEGVEEGARAGLEGELDATLDAGMQGHLSKARELVASAALRRADLYYLQPAERALEDYADDAARAKYGAAIEALRAEGQEVERRAAEEQKRAAEERERAAEAAGAPGDQGDAVP